MAVPATDNAASWWRYAMVLAAWLVTRVGLVILGRVELGFYPGGRLAFDDLDVYARWLPVLSDGRLPVDDMWQYPPLSAFFFLAGGIGSDPATALLLAIMAVDLILTIVLTRHKLAAGWYWVGFGVVIGPILVARFDVVPTLFAVLAVIAAAHPVRTGVWAAIGAGFKVWPVLVLAVVPRRRSLPALGSFVAITVLLLAGTALVFGDLTGFLGGQGSRGLQVESVAALPFLIINATQGGVELEYRYGAMEVAVAGAGIAAAVVTVVAVVGLVWLAVVWWRQRLAQAAPADIAFTVVLFSVVVSRVFSPQYSIWLLGLGALCLVAPRSRVRTAVWLVVAAAAIAQILYPGGYGRLLSGDPLMVTLQAVRVTLVVVAAAWSWYRVVVRPGTGPGPGPSQ
ncbi:MAG: glycosyltransferase 87 family protein [Candidatus Nanopelagicales bacterium]